jgi:hypothetical protein
MQVMSGSESKYMANARNKVWQSELATCMTCLHLLPSFVLPGLLSCTFTVHFDILCNKWKYNSVTSTLAFSHSVFSPSMSVSGQLLFSFFSILSLCKLRHRLTTVVSAKQLQREATLSVLCFTCLTCAWRVWRKTAVFFSRFSVSPPKL